MTILGVYSADPGFPPAANDPAASRVAVAVGGAEYSVDYIGATAPTAAAVAAALGVSGVPQSVMMWQARAAIATANLTAPIQNAVNASGNQAFIAAWEYATTVQRDSPMINALGAALGLTPAQIDALFISAAALSV